MGSLFPLLAPVLFMALSQSEPVDGLIGRLGADSPESRAAALRELLQRYESWTSADLDQLLTASRKSDAEIAKRADEALTRIRIRRGLGADLVRVLPDLDAALYFRGEEDRLWALREVGALLRKGGMTAAAKDCVFSHVGTPPLTSKAPEFIRYVLDEDVREFAPLVAAYLRDERPEVRELAILTLGWLNARAYEREIAERLPVDPAASVSLALMGAGEYLDSILELSKSEDFELAKGAIRALGYLGDRRAVAPLLLRLDQDDAKTRALAVRGLYELGDPSAAPRVVRLIKDPDERVRLVAIPALGSMRSANGPDEVRELLEDPSELVRIAAADYLARWTPFDQVARRDRLVAEIRRAIPKPGIELWPTWVNLGEAAPRPLKQYLDWLIRGSSGSVDLVALLDSLARTMEPSGHRKLLSRVTLDRPMESLADVRAFFRSVGMELEAPGPFAGRINAGVQVSAWWILCTRFKETLGFVVHKDRVVVLPWEKTLRGWVKKIDRE